MPSITTSLTKGQRITLLGFAAAFWVLTAASVVWSATHPWGDAGGRLGYLGPVSAVCSPLCAIAEMNIALGRIVADDKGLRTWRLLRRRTFRWDEIAAIEHEEHQERMGYIVRLQVLTHTGRRHLLPSPIDAWWGTNREFWATQRMLTERLAAAQGGDQAA